MSKAASTYPVRNALQFLPRRFQHFGYSYSEDYRTFINQFIAEDKYHPLCLLRRRIAAQRPKEGLWWHITIDKTTGPKRVVRSWVRRRLTNAFVAALKERGIDEHGRLLPAVGKEKQYKRAPVFLEVEKRGLDVSLEGSMKLHAEKIMVAAKYVDFKKETDILVDALLKARERALSLEMGMAPPRQSSGTAGKVKSTRPQSDAGRTTGGPKVASRLVAAKAAPQPALGWDEMMQAVEEVQDRCIQQKPRGTGTRPLRDTRVPNAGKPRTVQSTWATSPRAPRSPARPVKAPPPAPKFGTLFAKKEDGK